MKITQRMLTLALALLLLLSATAFAEGLSAPGALPLSQETIHFTVGVAQSSVVEDWNTNAQTLKIEKDLNVELEFVEYPSDKNEMIQKVELQIMAGGADLPDIILSDLGGLANLVKYGEMGMILPTNAYYDTVSYYADQNMLENGLDKDHLLSFVTCYNGQIYGLFRYHAFINNSLSASRMLVYGPWLETLGLEMPETTDEFADMLRAFKEGDPNGNNLADEIPLMGYAGTVESNLMRYLMNPFIYCQANYYIHEDDGTVGFSANKEGWKEGLKWIRSLVEEELISTLSLTQDGKQLTAIMNPEPEVVGALARISATNLGATDIRRGQYTALDPLEGPEGLCQTQWTEQLPTIAMVITKNCKNPEAAFRLGDYMCSEELSIWNRYGQENVDWVRPGEDAIGTFESLGYPAYMTVTSSWGVLQNAWWAQQGPYILTDKITCGQAATKETLAYNAAYAMAQNMQKELDCSVPTIAGLIFTEDEQKVVTEYQSTINSFVLSSFSEFITGIRDIDAEWDAYVAELDAMGLETYMEAVNSCYERMYGE